jgi:hypothetical protein
LKLVSRLGLLGIGALFVSQACGSDDGKQATPDKQPPAAQGGDGAAGEGSGGAAPSAGSGGRAGATSSAGESSGGVAGEPVGGSAGESTTAGGAAGGGAAGEGGALGDAGAGGAAESVTCEVAPTCSGTLADVGTGDFSIAFTLTTSAAVRSGVISQRSVCMHSKFWDIRIGKVTGGAIAMSIELDDGGANYTSFSAPAPLTDGNPHEVKVCRKAGQVYAFADGKLLASVPNQTPFSTLPALATLTTKCTALDGTVALVGTVTDVCVGAL